jgi:hypothetical protein
MRQTVQLATGALGLILLAAPAQAATELPTASGSATFQHFEDSGGHSVDGGCSRTFSGLGTASCTGSAAYQGGPLGDGIHVTGSVHGSGATTAGPDGSSPTAAASLTASGGDDFSGTGLANVVTQLEYYVTVLPLGELATAGLKIPLAFADAGFIHGNASSTNLVGGEADTRLRAFAGDLTIDGAFSSLHDGVSGSEVGGALSQSYGSNHSVVFDFSEGDAVAKVDLFASCHFGSQIAGHGTVNCDASADPFFGFDQAAFDLEMGSHTFNLSDFFRIEVSPGLEPAQGVPEPSVWWLMIAGFGVVGAATRRRRAIA